MCMLEDTTGETVIREYIKEPLDKKELVELLKMLGIPAADLVRKKEPVFEELYKGKKLTEAQWITAMVKHPVLMERPIVVKNGKAVICRPAERLWELVKK